MPNDAMKAFDYIWSTIWCSRKLCCHIAQCCGEASRYNWWPAWVLGLYVSCPPTAKNKNDFELTVGGILWFQTLTMPVCCSDSRCLDKKTAEKITMEDNKMVFTLKLSGVTHVPGSSMVSGTTCIGHLNHNIFIL